MIDFELLHQTRHLIGVLGLRERHHESAAARTGGATGAVKIDLPVLGRVVVHNHVDGVDVDAAGRNVGRDQHGDGAGDEGREHALTLVLRQTAVDGSRAQALALEQPHHAVGPMRRAHEHDRATSAGADTGGDRRALGLLHADEALLERVHGFDRGRDGSEHGILLVAPRERADGAVERGREQQRLRTALDLLEDALDLGHEAHVGHLIGLVEDDELDVGDGHLALREQVVQTSRGCNHDVDARLKRPDLADHGGAAVDGRQPEAARAGEGRQFVGDLIREFAGRDEDEGMRTALARRGCAGDQRQAKGERLAGPCLRLARDIAAGECVGDRHRLDGERGVEALAGEFTQQRVGEPERGEAVPFLLAALAASRCTGVLGIGVFGLGTGGREGLGGHAKALRSFGQHGESRLGATGARSRRKHASLLASGSWPLRANLSTGADRARDDGGGLPDSRNFVIRDEKGGLRGGAAARANSAATDRTLARVRRWGLREHPTVRRHHPRHETAPGRVYAFAGGRGPSSPLRFGMSASTVPFPRRPAGGQAHRRRAAPLHFPPTGARAVPRRRKVLAP